MQGFKNIIFDFGGIFIDVDYLKTEKAFIQAGIRHFHDLYSQHAASPLFEQLETGMISPAVFCHQLRQVADAEIADEAIIHCWNAMLGKFYAPAVHWLPSIKEKYKIYLFSNTNAIHYTCFSEIYRQQFGHWDFEDHFHKTYYSHLIGRRKPYKEAFDYVLQDQGLKAEETLFIDDTITNIHGAAAAGLGTLFLEPPKGVWELEW